MVALPHPLTSTAPHPLGSLDDVTTLPFLTPWDEYDIRRAREAAALPRPNRAERRRRARATRHAATKGTAR